MQATDSSNVLSEALSSRCCFCGERRSTEGSSVDFLLSDPMDNWITEKGSGEERVKSNGVVWLVRK